MKSVSPFFKEPMSTRTNIFFLKLVNWQTDLQCAKGVNEMSPFSIVIWPKRRNPLRILRRFLSLCCFLSILVEKSVQVQIILQWRVIMKTRIQVFWHPKPVIFHSVTRYLWEIINFSNFYHMKKLIRHAHYNSFHFKTIKINIILMLRQKINIISL